jgi:hypothetical protein
MSTRFNEARKSLATNKLGPGCYILPEVDKGPAFEFSSLQRFNSNYQDKIDYLMKTPHSKTVSSCNLKIIKNKDMTPYHPSTRLMEIEVKAQALDSRIKRSQTQKSAIIQERIQHKLQVLEEKNKRAQLRRHKQVQIIQAANQVVVGWSVLVVCLAVTKEVRSRHREHVVSSSQMRKARAEDFLKTLMSLSLVAGKFKLMLSRIRIKHALKVLTRFVPYIGKFLAKRRRHYAVRVIHVIENSLTHSMMLKMMVSWRQKVSAKQLLLVQRHWRKALKYRTALYLTLRAKWSLAEIELIESHRRVPKPRRARSIESVNDQQKGSATIPDEVKTFYIQQHIRQLTNDFYRALRQYKLELQETKTIHRLKYYHRQAGTLLNREEFKATDADLPVMPRLVLTVSKEVMKQLIVEALKVRSTWKMLQASRSLYITQPSL